MSELSPAQKSKALLSVCVFCSSLFFPSVFAQREHPRSGPTSQRISQTNLGGSPGVANRRQPAVPNTRAAASLRRARSAPSAFAGKVPDHERGSEGEAEETSRHPRVVSRATTAAPLPTPSDGARQRLAAEVLFLFKRLLQIGRGG